MGNNGPNGTERRLVPVQPQGGETALAHVETQIRGSAIDPEIVALAAAIHAKSDGKLTKAEALDAALHYHQTGEIPGRHSYIGTEGKTKGRIIEGYRAVERYVKQDYQVKYRSLTLEETQVHEIQPGDRALACEVYLLDAWRKCIAMGIPYQPIVGVTVVRKGDKFHVPTTKTAHWVLQKQARTDALRQVPGMPATVEEAEELAGELGVTLPEGARLSREQVAAAIAADMRPASSGQRVDASVRPAGFQGYDELGEGLRHEPEPAIEGEYTVDADAEFDAMTGAAEERRSTILEAAEAVSQRIQAAIVARGEQGQREASEKQVGLVNGTLNKLAGGDEGRRAVLNYLFPDIGSASELSSGACNALIETWAARVGEAREARWQVSEQGKSDVAAILAAVRELGGQQSLFEE